MHDPLGELLQLARTEWSREHGQTEFVDGFLMSIAARYEDPHPGKPPVVEYRVRECAFSHFGQVTVQHDHRWTKLLYNRGAFVPGASKPQEHPARVSLFSDAPNQTLISCDD